MKTTKTTQSNKHDLRDLDENVKALGRIKIIFVILFALMTVHLIYFVALKSDNLAINTYNPRLEQLEKNIIRGKILDNQGKSLSETVVTDGVETRIYPYENAFSHIVGYSIQGKTGIEALADLYLLKSNMPIYEKVVFDLTNKKKLGDNVITTLNAELQVKAAALLEGNRGSIVAIEPSTGKVLCMVSKPDFNPNDLIFNWDTLIHDEARFPLLNRATQGLYPPGSTFKIVTTIEYLLENQNNTFSYFCEGADDFDGKVIHCYNGQAHGEETLKDAFAKSCNTAFATIGESLDIDALKTLSDTLLYNHSLPYSMPTSVSSFNLTSASNAAQRAETVIGQGETLVTPLHNAMITATIANGGLLMEPYLIDRLENTNGVIVHQYLPKVYQQLIDSDVAETVTGYMVEVINSGTGINAATTDYQIAGKTGSAENPFGDDHAWFVGFAPADHPEIVIAIVVENAGSSGSSAVPMAKELFDLYLNSK